MTRQRRGENIAYHAARLLLVISACGTPRRGPERPCVRGRTLLAKLDVFVRYPTYLARALEIRAASRPALSARFDAGPASVESRMVRYLYGPWDHVYYAVLGYLIGKGLLAVEIERGTEVFRLTPAGAAAAAALAADPAHAELAERAALAHRAFSGFTGTRLKQFIYDQFPEIVARKLGATI